MLFLWDLCIRGYVRNPINSFTINLIKIKPKYISVFQLILSVLNIFTRLHQTEAQHLSVVVVINFQGSEGIIFW